PVGKGPENQPRRLRFELVAPVEEEEPEKPRDKRCDDDRQQFRGASLPAPIHPAPARAGPRQRREYEAAGSRLAAWLACPKKSAQRNAGRHKSFPARTYSPTRLPGQYHRRWRA